MVDRIIIRLMQLVLLVFILVAVFYQRPDNVKRAGYLPPENFMADITAGQRLFQVHCINCHGDKLQGTEYGPSLLHAYYHPTHHADVAFYLAVSQGVQQHHWQFGNMPAMTMLNPEDAAHLVLYVRQQQRAAGLY